MSEGRAVCGLPMAFAADGLASGECHLCGDVGPYAAAHFESQEYVIAPLCPRCGDPDLNPGAMFHPAGPLCLRAVLAVV